MNFYGKTCFAGIWCGGDSNPFSAVAPTAKQHFCSRIGVWFMATRLFVLAGVIRSTFQVHPLGFPVVSYVGACLMMFKATVKVKECMVSETSASARDEKISFPFAWQTHIC